VGNAVELGWQRATAPQPNAPTRNCFFFEAGVLDKFTGQSSFDKDGFAILASNASRLVIQRFDNPDWHSQLQKKHEF
jgi:hypothetical protein